MAATATDETPSVTAVSSPSARRLYYELANRGTATVEELSDTLEYDTDRVDALLTTLAAHDLVAEDDGVVQA
jgi:predicted transcriptional regulator